MNGLSKAGLARRLTSRIAKARGLDEIVAIVNQFLPSFDHIHTIACIHAFGKYRFSACVIGFEESLVSLLYRTQKYLRGGQLDHRQLANTVWAAARLHMKVADLAPPQFLRQVAFKLVEQAESSGSKLKCQDISNGLWAFAILQSETASIYTIPRLASWHGSSQPAAFKPQEIANSIWALATLATGLAIAKARPLAVFCCLGAELGGMRTHSSSIYPPPPSTASFVQRMDAQHLANVAWAVAAADLLPGEDALATLVLAATGKLQQFRPQELSNLCWALAATSAAVIPALGSATSARLPEFNNQELVNTAWAFAEAWPALRPATLQATRFPVAA
eukprot:TRINITY_DN106615_c0_g1_i1.p1 TRINITY_DN106615_c0_g1~~TRINITY_DN106615_c0_g1_i1.p1  ORF type:complete len:334 (-),score=58.83 TRINITY_DN106615_c0_g1_i1:26-1027(-)